MAERTLNHFALYTFTAEYWRMSEAERDQAISTWIRNLRAAAQAVHVYQVFPTRADADILIWTAIPLEGAHTPDAFFSAYAQATAPVRPLLVPTLTLWGVTKPSVYTRGKSPQELDALAPERKPYLIVYPFAKTAEWYLMSKDARQGMMNEHIRKGKEFPDITQLLLYSFGLQDQEFVVVYETDDITRFSDLVHYLRDTEARRFTLRDTPIVTAIHRTVGSK